VGGFGKQSKNCEMNYRDGEMQNLKCEVVEKSVRKLLNASDCLLYFYALFTFQFFIQGELT